MCLVKIFIVREYLGKFFRHVRMNFALDVENIIDDFVLMCIFVGNDFMPHLPGLNIRQGGIDILLNVYRIILPHLNGYMTKNGDINMKRMEKYPILNHLKAAKIQTKHAPNFSKSDNNKSIIIFFNHN